MTKRLQVLLEEKEFGEIRATAKRSGTSVADWVRQALRAARARESRSASEKLAALDRAVRHSFPTTDIDAMLDEIERGYRG